MKILLTGITGFVGSHLAELLLSEGEEVWGIARHRSNTKNLALIANRITLLNADVKDGSSILRVLSEIKPNYIFHLAAQSYVPESFSAPVETFALNALGCLHILEGVRQLKLDCAIHISGSSEEYGLVHPDELPIKESNPLRPQSPYGVSKVVQDFMAQLYYRSFGLKTIITRAFNHTGPRRGEFFVTSNFAKQIAEGEKHCGLGHPQIQVGNLESRRDFTDVRDMVRAYWLAIRKCSPGVPYNICSGKAISIQEVLTRLLSFSKVKFEIIPDPSRIRPSDVPILLGDSSKFRQTTGWFPIIPLERTFFDLLEYWRGVV